MKSNATATAAAKAAPESAPTSHCRRVVRKRCKPGQKPVLIASASAWSSAIRTRRLEPGRHRATAWQSAQRVTQLGRIGDQLAAGRTGAEMGFDLQRRRGIKLRRPDRPGPEGPVSHAMGRFLFRSSASQRSRNKPRPRARRDMTVPIGAPITVAISRRTRSSNSRSTRTSRYSMGSPSRSTVSDEAVSERINAASGSSPSATRTPAVDDVVLAFVHMFFGQGDFRPLTASRPSGAVQFRTIANSHGRASPPRNPSEGLESLRKASLDGHRRPRCHSGSANGPKSKPRPDAGSSSLRSASASHP